MKNRTENEYSTKSLTTYKQLEEIRIEMKTIVDLELNK